MSKLDKREIHRWAVILLRTRIVPIFVRPEVNRAIEREYERLLAERTKRRYRRKTRNNTWE
jgi:hypothetical protein